MLRHKTRENFIRILQDVSTLCESAISMDDELLIIALQESQDAVISVGTGLEKTVENPMAIISKMESLCEAFYMLSLNMDKRVEYGKQIADLLDEIILDVSNLPVSYQIVFFPYKAEMWDSLESIWIACKDDPACECKVVPIPYYHFDAEQDKWLYEYEINKFPEYVPVVHYADYDLNEQADAAFVHNPYDEYNHVTHIHSDYYSYNLKKYVNKLFYVPYYVTSGFIAENHKSLSVYQNADYLVVQSESFKEGLKEMGYAHKALVMGSPKLDRVIRLSGTKDNVPEDWKAILQGRKSLMLNTSLHQFLVDGELYLQKISRIFEIVKRRRDVAIVWRPHPLLSSTIESMRPELLPMYEQLQQTFLDEKIGILDMTPDIIHTVAAVDGYIGETSSSVVNLFEAAGKPVFILNNYITDDFDEKKKRQFLLLGCNKVGDDYYCTSGDSSDLFVVRGNAWDKITKMTSLENVPKWKPASMYNAVLNQTLYFTPCFSEEFFVYDFKRCQTRQISSLRAENNLNYRGAIAYQDKVFYLPNVAKSITEYDTLSNIWREHRKPIIAMQHGVTERKFEAVASYFVAERYIWMSNLYSNRVICFDMETADCKKYEIGNVRARYGAIAVDGEKLYLSNAYTGEIQVWDYMVNELVAVYEMPEGYRVHASILGRRIAHSKLWIANRQLYAIPNTSNLLVKLELETGKVSIVAKEFWEDVLESANFYNPMVNMVASFSQLVNEHTLLIQKRRDASLLEIDTRTGEYQIRHPMLAEGEAENLLLNEDGFEKLYTNGEFARRESKYFSLAGFLDDLANDRLSSTMIRQKEEMQTMAVNLDGRCGENVHRFMMDVNLECS